MKKSVFFFQRHLRGVDREGNLEYTMKTKQIDEYITKTESLIKANPTTTTISITYTHSKNSKDTSKIKPIVKFKTYDSKHGICHSFKTYKVKEFSKLFNALGPRGCNVNGEEMNGLSLSLSNVDKAEVIKDEEPKTSVEIAATESKSTENDEKAEPKKKNKKKKGKK